MTYVRKDLVSEQVTTADNMGHRDMVIVRLSQGTMIANIYNPNPGGDQRWIAAAKTQEIVRGQKAILCRDWNTHSPMWDSESNESSDSDKLVDWVEESGAVLLNVPDIATCHVNPASPSVIDLSFATVELNTGHLCTTEVRSDVDCGSDHEVLITTVTGAPAQRSGRTARYKMDQMDKERFLKLCAEEAAGLSIHQMTTPEEIDLGARRIGEAMTRALDRSTPKTVGKGTGKRWWNSDCDSAVRELRRAKVAWLAHRGNDVFELYKAKRKIFHAEVRKAKKEMWKRNIEAIQEPGDVFKALRWTRAAATYSMPPLASGSGTASTTTEKALLLLDTHTQAEELEEEATENLSNRRDRAARELGEVTEEEVRTALFRLGNTAPGTDSIPNSAWKTAWKVLGPHLTALFRGCLEVGWHPKSFKTAVLVVIPKPGRDKSLPRSYRLISLLSTLGKGLERLVARRLAVQAVELKIIPRAYASAAPRRAAADLTLALADKIKGRSRYKETTTFATYDIKGAFDAVKRRQMVRRLRQQGWPTKLIRWVESFLTGREVSLSIEGGEAVTRQVGGSLPQGSPVSPILYMLYMADLHSTCMGLGYADDGLLAVSSRNAKTNNLSITELLSKVDRWCRENELELDWDKTGLPHCRPGDCSAKNTVKLANGNILKPLKSLRWLGVWWDSAFNFAEHAKQVTAKAKRTTNALRALAGVYHGTPVKSLLHVVRSCVLPQLTYASSTWSSFMHKTRGTQRLELALRAALRAALPVYCTTPIKLLHIFSAVPTMEMLLRDYERAAAIRASTVDNYHPLYITELGGHIDEYKKMLPNPIHESEKLLPEEKGPPEPLPPQLDKEEAAEQHQREVAESGPNTVWAYSDGLRDENGRTGAGWAILCGGTKLCEGFGSCGTLQEVADAEAVAAVNAVRAAVENTPPEAGSLYLCLDNLGVAQRIACRSKKHGTSQGEVDEIRRLLHDWKGGTEHLSLDAAVGAVRWVPGHTNVPGNELVDGLAKRGCESEVLLVRPGGMSPASARRWKKLQLNAEFKAWTKSCEPRSQIGARFESTNAYKVDWLKGQHRSTIARILTARAGHGDFAEYHDRFDHTEAEKNCPLCQQPKEPFHPWSCLMQVSCKEIGGEMAPLQSARTERGDPINGRNNFRG
ncbi:uncharacterized protein BROUX77_003213 [Berkeleyomyces rouxiae]|uniref:uncharacterized protein n=1 Tax=Berkeleyomyces rouxiae TaxID=2035830 RepID=UPI003B7650ED